MIQTAAIKEFESWFLVILVSLLYIRPYDNGIVGVFFLNLKYFKLKHQQRGKRRNDLQAFSLVADLII